MINLNQQVFYAFPKCEIRPKEKDYVHGISAQSFGAYLITVQYCKQFNEWLYSNPFRTMSVVGLCKEHGGWDYLASFMLKDTRKGSIKYHYSIDLKRANQSCPMDIAVLASKIRGDSMPQHASLLRDICISSQNVVAATPDGEFHSLIGLHSGDYNTTTRNNFQTITVIAELSIELGYECLDDFCSDYNVVVYSDDQWISSAVDISLSIRKVMDKINARYVMETTEDIRDVVFLGHKFVRCSVGSSFWAPYPENVQKVFYSSILDSVNKTGELKLSRLQIFQSLVSCLMRLSPNASLYDRFQIYVAKIAEEFCIDTGGDYDMSRISSRGALIYFFSPILQSAQGVSSFSPVTGGSSLNRLSRFKIYSILSRKDFLKIVLVILLFCFAMAKSKKKILSSVSLAEERSLRATIKNQSKQLEKLKGKKKKGKLSTIVERNLLSSSIPRPYFKSTGDSDTVKVHGCEVIASIKNTGYNKFTALGIDPSNSNMFPRLAAMAKMYERFRFKKIRLRYHPGCPATRSGAVGLAIISDPTRSIDASLVELAAYKCSAVGPIPGSVETGWYRSKDPGWYVCKQSDDKYGDVDPLKRFQGQIVFMTDHADTTDDGAFGGYISVEYEIELAHMRPMPDISGVLFSDSTREVTDAGSISGLIDWKKLESAYGWFDFVAGAVGATSAYWNNGFDVSGDVAQIGWDFPIHIEEIPEKGLVRIQQNVKSNRMINRICVPPEDVPNLVPITPVTSGNITIKWTLRGTDVFEFTNEEKMDGDEIISFTHKSLKAIKRKTRDTPLTNNDGNIQIWANSSDETGLSYANVLLYEQEYLNLADNDFHDLNGSRRILLPSHMNRCWPLVRIENVLAPTYLTGQSYFSVNLSNETYTLDT
jgi:hypothetical protein